MLQLSQALKLSPDRFTPLARTPWAGLQIQRLYKSHIRPSPAAIGESWEVSCDPDFPSEVLLYHRPLLELLQEEPEQMLSATYVAKKGATCEILIKLLNADQPLSVQVHPRDEDPHLLAKECGKPESWLILHAEPGAGLYLGFSKPIARDKLRELLVRDADLRPYLQFVPVEAGDYFEIQPGVPHAIGPGITLLEPQRVLLGKSGKTYRFWDWGRRYDSNGAIDQERGKPRELHIDEGLRLIDPESQVGSDFVDGLRRLPEKHLLPAGKGTIEIYPVNDSYQVVRVRLAAQGALEWQLRDGFATMVSLHGVFTCEHRQGQLVDFGAGEPGFLPYVAFPMQMRAISSCDLVLVIPAGAQLSWTV